jgi:predicted permease
VNIMPGLASRLYSLTLFAFSQQHRAQYRDEMLDAFSRELADRGRRNGTWHAARFAVAACINAISSGLGERRRSRQRGGGAFQVFTPGIVGRDLLHATRALWKARGFTLVCALSLGIGMGTVMATLMLLRISTAAPRGVTPEGLVELLVVPQGSLRDRTGGRTIDTWSYPDFADLRNTSTGMSIAGWTTGQSVLRLPDAGGVRVETMYASANYFTTVGVALALGRGFDPDGASADREGGPQAIVSYAFWHNRLGSSGQVIGSTLVVNGTPHVIVGVALEGYRGHFAQQRPGFDLWLPLHEHRHLAGPAGARIDREVDWVRVLGRLTPGTSVFDANAAVSSIMTGLAAQHPASNAEKAASVEPYFAMGAPQRRDGRLVRAVALAAAGMVLLVVCLNISGMVLVRSATRERELAVRLAVGASRGRLMMYLLSEAVILATLGGAIGAAVIFGTPAAVDLWFGQADTELNLLRPDGWVVLYCAALCLATSLVFGLLPAVRFSRPTLVSALKDDAGGGRRVSRIHRLTAAVQAGIAVPFLVTGGVLLDQIQTTASADLGFDSAGIYAVPLDLTAAKRAPGDADYLLRTVHSHLERVSGVSSVTAANGLPLDGQYEGRRSRVARDGAPQVSDTHTTRVSPDYFKTMEIRLVRGRGITDADVAGSEPVAVISEALKAQLFPEREAVGERVTFGLDAEAAVDSRWPQLSLPSAARAFTIVGVAADSATSHLGPPKPQLFVSLAQHPSSTVYVIARSAAAAPAMASAFEDAVRDLYPDPDVVRSTLVTTSELLRRQRIELSIGSGLAGIVGVVALTLAALGVFGVIGFMVATRTREIGIRIALGATRSRVLGTILGDALKLAVPGVAAGLLVAVLIVQEISWYSLGVVEPALYVGAAGVALFVALLASLPAARRAAAVEPLIAMRSE